MQGIPRCGEEQWRAGVQPAASLSGTDAERHLWRNSGSCAAGEHHNHRALHLYFYYTSWR